MKIPEKYFNIPKIFGESLVIISGHQHLEFYKLSGRNLELLDFFQIDRSKIINSHQTLSRKSGRGMAARSSVRDKNLIATETEKIFKQQLKKIAKKLGSQMAVKSIFVFSSRAKKLLTELPGAWIKKQTYIFSGNYRSDRPLVLLEKIYGNFFNHPITTNRAVTL